MVVVVLEICFWEIRSFWLVFEVFFVFFGVLMVFGVVGVLVGVVWVVFLVLSVVVSVGSVSFCCLVRVRVVLMMKLRMVGLYLGFVLFYCGGLSFWIYGFFGWFFF